MNKIYKELGLNSIYKINNIETFHDFDSESSTFSFSDTELLGGSSTPVSLDDVIIDDDFETDCKGYPSLPHILPAVDRIICIGDIHGDFKLMIDCLELGKVIKRNPNIDKKTYPKNINDYQWTGNKSVVVQVGDQIDRCRPTLTKCDDPTATPDDEGSDIIILEFMSDLHKKALESGGAVYSLLGNHEIMNVEGNMNYVSYEGAKQFLDDKDIEGQETKKIYKDGIEKRRNNFSQGEKYAKFMACTRQSVLIIGSNIFVHAAVTPKIAEKFKRNNLQNINIAVRKWLLGELDNNSQIKNDKGNAFKLGQILTTMDVSLFWPRILGHLPSDKTQKGTDDKVIDTCAQNLYPVLDMFNCNNMIVGHTPQFSLDKFNPHGISSACNFKEKTLKENLTDQDNVKKFKNYGIWRIDAGASTAFNYHQGIENPDSETRTLDVDEDSKIISATVPQVLEIKDDKDFTVLKMENGKYIELRFNN